METQLLSCYLRLFHCHWLNPVQFSRLLAQARTLDQLLSSDETQLADFGLTPIQMEQLHKASSGPNPQTTELDLRWASVAGQDIVCFEDARYPELLRQIDTAPPLLYVRGNANALANPQIAVVGSRKASSYGLRNAYWMAYELGLAGLSITSGMARGIDTRAHQGALASGRATIAVVGTGADIVYPSTSEKLAVEMAESGALVSEFPLGTLPLPANFPRRNRIMSGLSKGTLVVEAALKSGSLITARLAMEQNREVFAIPGLITNPLSAGCHKLIADGARLVAQPMDILQELGIESIVRSSGEKEPDSTAEDLIKTSNKSDVFLDSLTRLIGYQGCELQNLLDATGLEYQTLISHLLELEIAGKIQTLGGRYYRA